MGLIGLDWDFPKRSLPILGERKSSKDEIVVSYLLLNNGVFLLEEGMNYGCMCPQEGASLLACAHMSRQPGGSLM